MKRKKKIILLKYYPLIRKMTDTSWIKDTYIYKMLKERKEAGDEETINKFFKLWKEQFSTKVNKENA